MQIVLILLYDLIIGDPQLILYLDDVYLPMSLQCVHIIFNIINLFGLFSRNNRFPNAFAAYTLFSITIIYRQYNCCFFPAKTITKSLIQVVY